MKKRYKIGGLLVGLFAVVSVVARYLHGRTIAVLQPRGIIATQERKILIFAALLSLLVVVPVFVATFTIAWKYREGSTARRKSYRPNLDGNRWLETAWWLGPLCLIIILGVVTWRTSHSLDPYRALDSNQKPLRVQVVSLDWKWLFIYPDQHVASVNMLQFPAQTPLNLEITSDAPMNSFWVPQLGGQVYAMAGMNTELHLMADKPGSYRGVSANISGAGFAGMHFTAQASSPGDFSKWVKAAQQSPQKLDLAAYNQLAKPSEDNPTSTYALMDKNLYNDIIMKYMAPAGSAQNDHMQMVEDND